MRLLWVWKVGGGEDGCPAGPAVVRRWMAGAVGAGVRGRLRRSDRGRDRQAALGLGGLQLLGWEREWVRGLGWWVGEGLGKA